MKTTEPAQLWLHLRTVPQEYLKAWACFCFSTRLPMKSIVSWAHNCDFSYFLSLSPSSINLFFCLCFQKWVCGFITLEVHAAQIVYLRRKYTLSQLHHQNNQSFCREQSLRLLNVQSPDTKWESKLQKAKIITAEAYINKTEIELVYLSIHFSICLSVYYSIYLFSLFM